MAEMPLVGRDEELAYLREVRQARPTVGVVVAGRQGVGKSRLVAEAAADARSARWSVERVDGASAAMSVPLSAFAHLAPSAAVASGEPLRLMVAVTDSIGARSARGRLVLLVDDAHLLDEVSLALLRRAATLPNLFLLVTVRSDEPVPAPIVGLWKDGYAHRLELQPLSRHETYRLAAETLGTTGPTTLQQFWRRSLGNPLYLRELLLSGGDPDGPKSEAASAGQRPGGARRLAELVATRIGTLDPEQRRALEILTVTGPVGHHLVTQMVPAPAVETLVERGLIALRDDEPQPVVLLGHPVYGIVTADHMTGSRVRDLRSQVLTQLEQLESERGLTSRDAVPLVTLRLDLGERVEAPELLAAVRYVRAAYPRAVAERLAVGSPQLDGATAAVAAGEPAALPSEDDLAVAERLARRAWEADGTVAAGLALATMLVARKSVAEATQLLDTLEARAVGEHERTHVALAQAALEYWVLGRADRAEQVLLAGETRASDGAAVARLRRLRAGIALNVGRVAESVALAESLLSEATATSSDRSDPTDVRPEVVMASATAAAGLALQGRAAESMELTARFLAAAQAHASDLPEVLAEHLLARLFAARILGRLDEAEWLGYVCYEPAVENASTVGMAVFTGALGQVALDKGQPVIAIRRLREAEVLLRECDAFGYRPFVLANLAVGLAQVGDADGAAHACEQASAEAVRPRFFDPEIALARAWAHAADGRMADAASAALAAADQAGAVGLRPFEAGALHAAVRFGQAGEAAARLQALSVTTASPLVEAFARHAAACAAGDGRALADVSIAFEDLGAQLLAAEAAGHAATELGRAGRRRDATRMAARVDMLAHRTGCRRSPTLRLAARPPTLTAREHEVAVLAVGGLTSKDIAERLVVSTRTVESHLYRAFAKLGVSDRAELADVLEP